MSHDGLLLLYLLMMFLQTVHIFEEIATRAYDLVGSLNKYLVVASVLLFISYLALGLMLVGIPFGTYIAMLSAVIGLGNGIIHLVGYIKTGSRTSSLGSGVFSGIPLGIVGGLVLVGLVSQLF